MSRLVWSNSNQALLLLLLFRFCFESCLVDGFPKLLLAGLFVVIYDDGESLLVADIGALDAFYPSQCTLDADRTCAARHSADLDLALDVLGRDGSGKKNQKIQ